MSALPQYIDASDNKTVAVTSKYALKNSHLENISAKCVLARVFSVSSCFFRESRMNVIVIAETACLPYLKLVGPTFFNLPSEKYDR